ncbi:MAG: hypothetical protein AB7K24_10555 [Gemmataceae bacterium]
MPVFVEVTEYAPASNDVRIVSFAFEVFVGLGPILFVSEHKGYLGHEHAEALVRRLHRKNLCFSWLAGFPGMFPLISFLCFRSQVNRIRKQASQGRPDPVPGTVTPAEAKQRFVMFLVMASIAIIVIFGWYLMDPGAFVGQRAR